MIVYFSTPPETALPGQLITTITARDLDSGSFGDQGIRYSLTGTGANLFHVDSVTGAITVAECPDEQHEDIYGGRKRKREIIEGDVNKKVNLTLVAQTGIINQQLESEPEEDRDEQRKLRTDHNNNNNEEFAYKVISNADVMGTSVELQPMGGNGAEEVESNNRKKVPGRAPCLDFETQPVYFLMYKVSIL